jgi:phage gp45-like
MSISRGTVREFEDNHLVQEIKEADIFHSETASNKGAPLERFQMVGMTAFPLKQQKEEGQQQQQQPQQASQDGSQWNHSQPKGPAAEALMLYLNGSRAHPVALVDDRRVRPYDMSEGEGANYAPDGSEQMVLFKETGTYVVSLDGKSVKDKDSSKTRFASLRHVNKKMQSHKIEKQQQGGGGQQAAGQQQEKYKHEGDSVNTEVRCTKDRIEFRAGDTVVGYYEASSQTWYFKGKTAQMEFTDKISEKVGSSEVEIKPSIVNVDSADVNLSKNTWIGQDSKDTKAGPKVGTEGGPAAKAFAKV